jgi:hypothetical protein
MFNSSLSSIFIMDASFTGLVEKVNNFSVDGIFANDNRLNTRQAQWLRFAQQPSIGHKEFTKELGNAQRPTVDGVPP